MGRPENTVPVVPTVPKRSSGFLVADSWNDWNKWNDWNCMNRWRYRGQKPVALLPGLS
jgi:hypothetical protein